MADTYELRARSLPLDDSWDVVVVGGGPSGCAAAAASAREGARTLLVEATGCLGGMGTSGLVPAWCPFSDKEKLIYRGLAQQVFEAATAKVAHVRPGALDWVPIDAEALKAVYDDLVSSAGVTTIFGTALAAVEASPCSSVPPSQAAPSLRQADTLILSSKAGLQACRAKVYVDCTGDADLAAWAGADSMKGDESTGDLQPASLCFTLTNVDDYAFLHGPSVFGPAPDSVIRRAIASGRYPGIPDLHVCANLVGPGAVGFNAGHLWNVDNTDPTSVSRALVEGRRMAATFHAALAEFHPKAFANAHLTVTAPLMGIRETRRIVGDYVLSGDDYLSRASFEDEICRNSYYIDIHHSVKERELERSGKFDWEERCAHYGPGDSHGIPYRCLTPRGLTNVLVAGRSISCDRAVQASIRVMPVCLCTGEAAGVAAALAAASGVPASAQTPSQARAVANVHLVDTDALRRRLREYGAYLP